MMRGISMKNSLRHTQGVSMLEVLLVLVIAASILTMSVQFYNRNRTEQDFVQIQNNVDTLFQALRMFYQSNCQSGVLSPFHDPPVDMDTPFLINDETLFNDNLITKGFLSASWQTYNIQVDDTFGYQGYSVKLIPILKEDVTRDERACFRGECDVLQIPNRKILLWQLEVAVKVNDVYNAQAYGTYIGAQCIVESISDTNPVDCAIENSPDGQILVWQLMPSDPFLQPRSDSWLFNPVVKNFNMLYTHDPMYEKYDPAPEDKQLQYYLCGG